MSEHNETIRNLNIMIRNVNMMKRKLNEMKTWWNENLNIMKWYEIQFFWSYCLFKRSTRLNHRNCQHHQTQHPPPKSDNNKFKELMHFRDHFLESITVYLACFHQGILFIKNEKYLWTTKLTGWYNVQYAYLYTQNYITISDIIGWSCIGKSWISLPYIFKATFTVYWTE